MLATRRRKEEAMTQGKLTKEEALHCLSAVGSMFEGIPKSKRKAFIGELNDVTLFLEQASRELPSEETQPT